MPKTDLKKPSIFEAALHQPKFSIVCKACIATGLAETLKVGGPYTFFAPTNEAFSLVPKAMLETLLKSENKEKLLTLLTHHVIPGSLTPRDLKEGKIRTLSGKKCEIHRKDGRLSIDQAQISETEIECSNGSIYMIDQVILPQTT